jgi:hypothetical protein
MLLYTRSQVLCTLQSAASRRIVDSNRRCSVVLRVSSKLFEVNTSVRAIPSKLWKRALFNARNVKIESSETSRNQKAVDKSTVDSTEKESTTENANSTSSNSKVWEYTKHYSSNVYNTVLESTRSSMHWLGSRITHSLQNTRSRIRQYAQQAIEDLRVTLQQRLQGFAQRIITNVNDRTQALINGIVAPIRSIFKSIREKWRATPIWNRFFYWSLSAIAVYGIATTLPKEIIRLAIQSKTVTTGTTETATSTGAQNPNDKETISVAPGS